MKSSTPIVATNVEPGYSSSTGLGRNAPLVYKAIMKGMGAAFGRSPEECSRQLIWAALGPDGKFSERAKELHGAYVSTVAVREASDFAISDEGHVVQEQSWVSARMLRMLITAC